MTKRISLIFILLLSMPMVILALADDTLNIPQDSIITKLHQSYNSKLDSANILHQNKQYKEAVALYEKAFEELKEYSKQRREITESTLEKIYETEKKEKEIAFLNETLPLKRKQNLLLAIFCIILTVILILLFTLLKYRLRTIRQKSEHQENETKMMRLEKERQELEVELHKAEVEKYQKELLAESLLVNHKNKILEDLRLFITRHPELKRYRNELEVIFRNESAYTEKNEFKTDVKEVHPAFYTRLQKQAENKLTPLDLEYCRMIMLKMSSKEMADIMHVDPKTIRVGKYRLKQKLGLIKEDDLGAFIEEMIS